GPNATFEEQPASGGRESPGCSATGGLTSPARPMTSAGTWLGFDWPLIGYLVRVGVPMALANMFRHGSRVVFLAIAGSALGVSLQAAVGLALQVRLLGILVALAFQTAAATLVGQAVGRGDYPQAEMLGRRS